MKLSKRNIHIINTNNATNKNNIVIKPNNTSQHNDDQQIETFTKIPPITTPKIEPQKTDINFNVSVDQNPYAKRGYIPQQIFFYCNINHISWMQYMSIYSFRKLNPDWKVTLYYNPHNQSNSKRKNYIQKVKEIDVQLVEWEQDNELFKWYILYEEGGIYSSLDILYFRPIQQLWINKNCYDTVACQSGQLLDSFLMSSVGNEFYKDIYTNSIQNQLFTDNNPVSKLYADIASNECLLLHEASQIYPYLGFYNMPYDVVYPFDETELDYVLSKDVKIDDLSPETIGCKWYSNNKQMQQWASKITASNYKKQKNIFANICKKVTQ